MMDPMQQQMMQQQQMMGQPMMMGAPMPMTTVTTVTHTMQSQDPFTQKNGCTEDQMDEEFNMMSG